MTQLTYKTDDSFFTTVLPPFSYYGASVKSWFMKNNYARFRYIKDIEVEREFWNVAQVQDIYPGIKTISVVLNPWARMRYAYLRLCEMQQSNDTLYADLSSIDFGSFTDFIVSLPNQQPIGDFKFTLATPVSDWISNNGMSVDFVLKDESLSEDFTCLQEYFCDKTPLEIPKKLPSYKRFYNKTTKSIVAEVFKKDIDRFGYKF